MPQLGETVTEGTILTWLVKVGDSVKEDDPIIEISTDKVDTEVPSPFSGIVSALLVEEGETVEVGTPLLELEGDEKEENPSTNKKEKEESKKEVYESLQEDVDTYIRNDKNQKLSPVVRKLAQKHNIEVSDVTGTGNGGRITRKDIEAHINSSEPIVDEKQIQSEEKVAQETFISKNTQPITRLRKKMAENMILSKQTSAHVMTSVEVDFEVIEQLRIENKETFKSTEGFSLTYLPFISRATIESLKEFPVVNSSFNLEKEKFTIHEEINLGIAVDLNQEGLLVGTIRSADSYNLIEIARKTLEISKLLRGGEYQLEDVIGSSFTISNNGSFNSYLTSPIINQPNVAILSAESVKKRAVVIEGPDGSDSISIRHIGLLSLTWDHRVFDGSTALLFLNAIKDKLEKTNWKQELL
jgi:2-oxoglutarate dehydrogenase E2 component (dihydrolipoamide succinyltransferase)